MACNTAATRTAAKTFSSPKPFSRSTLRIVRIDAGAHTSVDRPTFTPRHATSSKSRGSTPCVRIAFIRSPARMVPYFSFDVRVQEAVIDVVHPHNGSR